MLLPEPKAVLIMAWNNYWVRGCFNVETHHMLEAEYDTLLYCILTGMELSLRGNGFHPCLLPI